MARRWVMRARRSEKPRQPLCFAGLALQVWLKRWNIPRFWETFLPKLCGKQYNGDYKSLDLEKGCNKTKKGGERSRFADSSWLYGNIYGIIPAEWYRYYVGRSRQGDFESFIVKAELSAQTRNIWDNRYHWPNESPHVNQSSWEKRCIPGIHRAVQDSAGRRDGRCDPTQKQESNNENEKTPELNFSRCSLDRMNCWTFSDKKKTQLDSVFLLAKNLIYENLSHTFFFFFCSRLNNQTTMSRQCRACEGALEAKPSTERERARERGRLNECFVPAVVTVKHSLSQIIPSDARDQFDK